MHLFLIFPNVIFPFPNTGCILAGISVGIIKPATGLYISEVVIINTFEKPTKFAEMI